MWFLLRVAFWLGVVLVLLPTGGSEPLPKSQVSAGEAFSAAKAAVSDMQQFCARQPSVCEVGSQTAVTLGQRAQVGAKMLYEFLQERFGSDESVDCAVHRLGAGADGEAVAAHAASRRSFAAVARPASPQQRPHLTSDLPQIPLPAPWFQRRFSPI